MSQEKQKDTPEQSEFRAYCRKWLVANKPGEPPVRLPQSALEVMTTDQLDYLQAWQKSAYDAGLVGCDYPKDVGGGGRKDCQRVANEEMQRIGTPFFPNIIGLGMAAPTIFFHGSDDLKKKLLPKLFSGEEIWCQGFSEPGAGSDLASMQTSVVSDGEDWLMNGHKVWTSCAHFASYMIILVRSGNEVRYQNLSYFVVPIKSALGEGVTVSPLIKMTGETGFNEVVFEDLKVPDAYRLDEVGSGWKVAMTTLAHERSAGVMVTPAAGGMTNKEVQGTGSPDGLIELAKTSMRNGKLAADDPIIRDRIMKAMVRERAFWLGQKRAKVGALCDDNPARLSTQIKLVISEIRQMTAEIAMETMGAAGTLYLADENAPVEGQWPLAYMNTYGGTIAAGTSEIQRNILGERILGLPKSK